MTMAAMQARRANGKDAFNPYLASLTPFGGGQAEWKNPMI